MKQHPIPQNILDVEFKLFTKFTVREFIYMAAGIGFGGIFLYFATRGDLTYYIAIPVFLLSSAIGLFLGLVPLNEQKADVFLTNYIGAITRPTRRVWKNDQFDKKVEGIAQERGIVLTSGTMSRKEEDQKSTAKIIGGVSNPQMGTNQFIQATQTVLELEKEEEQRLAEIEHLASQQVTVTSPTANNQPSESLMPIEDSPLNNDVQPTPYTQEPANQPMTGLPGQQPNLTTQPEITQEMNPVVAPVTEAPNPDNISPGLSVSVASRPRVTITKDNISQFALQIPGFEPQPNSIYLRIEDGAQPLHRAMVMVRDNSENVLQVYHTNSEGNLLQTKQMQPGEYLVDIEHGQYNFPRLHYIIESGIYPPILVTPIN